MLFLSLIALASAVCPTGQELDPLTQLCVAVSCASATACPKGTVCVSTNIACIRAPCASFKCVAASTAPTTSPPPATTTTTTIASATASPCTGLDELTCPTIDSARCLFLFDVNKGVGQCSACNVKCLSPDLDAYAKANNCVNGAVMSSCCAATCRPPTSCRPGFEYDKAKAACVPVSCVANPCASTETCVPNKIVCVTSPCQQFTCAPPACAVGEEFDALTKQCVAVSCDAKSACAVGQTCVKQQIACIRAPCPQFQCEGAATCSSAKTSAECGKAGCTWLVDTKARPVSGTCTACLVECATPDLGAFAKSNNCANGAAMTSCCTAACLPSDAATTATATAETTTTTTTTLSTKTACADVAECKSLPQFCKPLGQTVDGCKTCSAQCQFVLVVASKSEADVLNAAKLLPQGLTFFVTKSADGKFLVDVSGQVPDTSAGALPTTSRDTIAGAANIESAAVVESTPSNVTATDVAGAASSLLAVSSATTAALLLPLLLLL